MRFTAPFRRQEKPPAIIVDAAGLGRREKVLAHAQDGDRWLIGTRIALILVTAGEETRRIPWESVQAADWDNEEERLVVSEVGEYGEPRARHVFAFRDPALLLQLVRERVTASVVLQRGYLVTEKKGFKVIGRRSPEGGAISWMFEFDAGIDPEDPAVRDAADAVLAQARSDVGEA